MIPSGQHTLGCAGLLEQRIFLKPFHGVFGVAAEYAVRLFKDESGISEHLLKLAHFLAAESGGAALMVESSVIARAAGRSIGSAWGRPFGRGCSRRSSRRPTAQERPRVYTVLLCDFPSRSSDSAGILCR